MKFERKYNYNENYFEKIDSPEKAYCLGFWYADGYVETSPNHVISIAQIDLQKDILEKIAHEFGSDKPIYERKHEKGRIFYVLQFNGEKLTSDLIKLGCTTNKSLTLQFPTYKIVPIEFMSHFIRGYFDGDGCIWNGKRKKWL